MPCVDIEFVGKRKNEMLKCPKCKNKTLVLHWKTQYRAKLECHSCWSCWFAGIDPCYTDTQESGENAPIGEYS